VGIQFTISQNKKRLANKERQIEKSKIRLEPADKIQDIVLVSMPMEHILEIYRKWEQVKITGGADNLLSKEMQKTIIKEVLKGVFTKEELDKI
jgi:prephenate dehydrogenase